MPGNTHPKHRIITVALNPTIDRVLEAPDFRIGRHVKARLLCRQPSGKAFNVSRALAALGVRSIATGFVGAEAAVQFEAAASSAGITPAFVPLAGRTRENTTVVDPVNHTETHIREEGPTVAPDDLQRLRETLVRFLGPGTTVVLTGSLAPGIAPGDFGHILDDCLALGARVVVDTSGPALLEAVRRRLWLLKPNREELTEIVGREATSEADLLEDVRRTLASVECVLLSDGENGAYLATSEGVWHGVVRLRAHEVRSTVGCGDALLAGYLAAVAQTPSVAWPSSDLSLRRHASQGHMAALGQARTWPCHPLREAIAVAAASALNELPAVFSLEDVRRLLPQVQIRSV